VEIAGIVNWAAGCYLKSAGSPAGTVSMLKIGPFTQQANLLCLATNPRSVYFNAIILANKAWRDKLFKT
jgi:hypothetical protein